MLSLEEKVDLAEREGDLQDVSELIVELYEQNDDNALDLCIKLAMCEYGGHTYKSDFQNIAALGVLHWNLKGLRKLGEVTISNSSYRAINNVTRLLSHISSKTLALFPLSHIRCANVVMLDVFSEKYKTSEWITVAKEVLIDVVKSVETDEKFPIGITVNMGFSTSENATEHIFAALIARWFNLSSSGIKQFSDLLTAKGRYEIDYHNFLASNPYILEPFHAQIWSKPRFGEELVPDFLIRSMDNSYTVVEIERPDVPILTKAGELSAQTTHAKRQALDFRTWVLKSGHYAAQRFPGIYNPYCLVVIGRESELNEMQIERLKQENESTQGILKIVGFDWLLSRVKSTLDNMINYGFDRQNFQETVKE
ncbi:Shedu anti-phage system protein SduA domain-containing protein [Chryseobacterium sp. 22543]|uniref:Shedu anti-phage system protein SduA domain-containing protein n=1 Tax=Chryseobacterium sp. 22543 TaxID=3453940 RepID=UPI003F857AB9